MGERDCEGLTQILCRGERAGEKNPRLYLDCTVGQI